MPWFADLIGAARPIRAPLLVLVLAAVALLVPQQTRDMLASLDGPLEESGFQAAMFLLTFLSWFWSRTAINVTDRGLSETVRRRQPDAALTRIQHFRIWLPRAVLIGGVAFALGLQWRDGSPTALWVTFAWAVPLLVFVLCRMAIWRLLIRNGVLLPPERELYPPADRGLIRRLVRESPFHDPVAAALLALGFILFLAGALESFAGIGRFIRYGIAVELSVIFPGPSVALFGMAMMIGPLTLITLFFDAHPIRLPSLGITGIRFPALFVLVVWVLLIAPQHFHMHTVRVVHTAAAPAGGAQPQTLAEMFDHWRQACAPKTPDGATLHPVVVSLSGGASMAALWGARVLQAVDQDLPTPSRTTARSCIFAISGISGGSLGAAAFEAAAMEDDRPGCGVASLRDRHMGRDALGPLLGGMVFYDAPRAMLSWAARPLRKLFGWRPDGGDRAEAIEHGFEHLWAISHPAGSACGGLKAGLAQPYATLFPPDGPFLPIWIANGTSVATGSRILTAPFASSQQSGGKAVYDNEIWPFRAAEDARALLGADVPISTAINNTARFPYLEPAGELLGAHVVPGRAANDAADKAKDKWAAQLVDGGYFDNEGILTAIELIHWLQRRPGYKVEPILVQATTNGSKDVTEADVVRCGGGPDDPSVVPRHSLISQALAPILGLYNVRGGHSAVYLRAARDWLCPADSKDPRRFLHFMLPGKPSFQAGKPAEDVPLNWTLSRSMAAWIWDAFDAPQAGNQAEAGELRRSLRDLAGARVGTQAAR